MLLPTSSMCGAGAYPSRLLSIKLGSQYKKHSVPRGRTELTWYCREESEGKIYAVRAYNIPLKK